MVLNEYNNLVAKCYAGDLLDARVDIIFHVTNCMGVMGAGIAKSIKNKWPKVFTEYKKYLDENTASKSIGTYQSVDITEYAHTKASQVVNIFGEYSPSRTKRAIEYDETLNALEMFRDDIIKTYKNDKKVVLGFPYLFGCGLAGGDWRIMKSIIFSVFEKYSDKVEIHFYKLKK
jgi:O-acetyl-ADP-ribose deacetylase (regulator of RNase III)